VINDKRLHFAVSRSTPYGAWLAAGVLALISCAILLAAGPRQTRHDVARCKRGYANARTAAESLALDSMHVQTSIPKLGTLFHSAPRCASFR
jgi:hypothetical protein